MFFQLSDIPGIVARILREDRTLETIDFTLCLVSRADVAPIISALVAHPNVVKNVWLACADLTDVDGVRLACVVANSYTIRTLNIPCNNFTEKTYLALARALESNRTLKYLNVYMNKTPIDRTHVDAAFVASLRCNSKRSRKSCWCLYEPSFCDVDYGRLMRQ